MHAKLKPSWKMKANRHDNLGTLSDKKRYYATVSVSIQNLIMCLSTHKQKLILMTENYFPPFLTAHGFTFLDS